MGRMLPRIMIFNLVGHPGQDGCPDIGNALHAKGGGVVLVEHQRVEAHLFGVDLLVDVAVVELGAYLGVV